MLRIQISLVTLFLSISLFSFVFGATSDQVKVSSTSNYVDNLKFFHVTGEVTNGLPNVITSVQVFGVFYDADNKIVGTGFTYAEPQTIAPGGNASFDLPLAEEISISQEKIQNYSVQAYYQ